MNPKAAEAWNFALAKLESARQLIESGQEEQTAYQAAQNFITDMATEDHDAAEAFTAAKKILTYVAAISPSEDRLPAP